jgi:hypothetical protein
MSWTAEMIQAVWEKGQVVSENNPDRWRKDQCGAWIGRDEYGDRTSQYGWEIDHISPGGSDALSNLRPLQWKNNADKSDGRLKCNVAASGSNNIDKG